MKYSLNLLIALIISALAVCTANSQTTEFTYQGNLKVGASPTFAPEATVNYDFEFRLCNSDSASCAAAPGLIDTNTHLNVPVTDGVFTVKLNFTAANAFDGSPRWLEIYVRPAGGGAFTPLTPRQQITSTPYAIKSKSADTSTNSQQLGGIAANQYLQTNGNGSGLTNLNAGSITTGTLPIANGGTGSTTKNFVDTSTDQTSIGGNKTFTGNLTVNGNLGIGTIAPIGKLHLNVPGSGNPISALTVDVGTFGTGTNSINSYFFKARDLGLGGTPAFLIRGDGNVGIGTAAPVSSLHLNGNSGSFGLTFTNSANTAGRRGYRLAFDNDRFTFQRADDAGNFAENQVTIDQASGNVGIGTVTPTERLDVIGNIKASGTISGAVFRNTNERSNDFFGTFAGQSNTNGVNNAFFGTNAGFSNTTGSTNAFFGGSAGTLSTTGTGNTFSGFQAGAFSTSGGNNAFFGTAAGARNGTGSNNTAIGSNADVGSGGLTNATAIGSGAVVFVSNKIRLGNTAVTVIEGQVAYTFSSDKNLKENFLPVDGRDVLRKIRGFNMTSWNYIGQDPTQFRHYGPMAQDFYSAFGRDEFGIFGSPTTINSGDMSGVMLAAIKELSTENEEMKSAIISQEKVVNNQQKQIASQQTEIDELKQIVCSLKPAAKGCMPR